jgi:hypothetical protein
MAPQLTPFTICVTLPLLTAKLLLPLYSAVIVWVPALKLDMLKLACPLLLRGVGPASTVVPSLNVTLPSVTALLPLVTVAVKVTDCPNVDGLSEEVTLVVVVAAPAACVTVKICPATVIVPVLELIPVFAATE